MSYISLFFIATFLVVAGPLRAQPEADSIRRTTVIRIVVMGSSTAAGAGATHPDSAWVNRYRAFVQKNYPGTEVINLARGGYSTYHLMPGQAAWPPAGRPMPDTARNITKALSLRPNAIILNLPSNDAAAGYALEEQLANFDTIVQSSRRAGVPIWVGSTQPRHFSAAKIWIQLLARDSILEKYGAFAVNFWDDVAEPNGLIQWQTNSGDGIHLNNTGHRLLFERIREKNILPYRIKE
jgi:lysophospholipase L1-like esterase